MPRPITLINTDSADKEYPPNGGFFLFQEVCILKIAVTGTHGTGKTSLAEALSNHTGLPLITEQARIVAAEMDLTDCNRLLNDQELAKAFQWRVLERQIAEQRKRRSSGMC
ncbi:hypothetical protein Daud_0809 [Candidatus Desulforudis audaxviator MP104C]|uniref:NadR/Ttd14 AAA domain-containing protein n=1 Tax=Desulforudis audaxviator (strain MP104C) TaxID=477974 RepID=B1I2X9_DESAP|nr:hypothetical protein Daud_0809 [Candidatus Desulforudis audaxviator MP104C]